MTEAVTGTLPVSLASRLGFSLALIGVGLMVLAMLGNRTGVIGFDIAVPAFGIGMLVTITAVALGGFGLIRGWLSPTVVGGTKGWLAILIGVVAVGLTLSIVGPGLKAPRVHDVTTAPADPPEFVTLYEAHYAGRNYDSFTTYDDSREAIDVAGAYPDLKTRSFGQPMEAVFAAAEAAARTMGWEIAAVVPEDGRIEATATTKLFRYKDDVVIRVRPDGEGGASLDIRSASRVGEGDLGANAVRITAFMAALDKQLQQHSGGE